MKKLVTSLNILISRMNEYMSRSSPVIASTPGSILFKNVSRSLSAEETYSKQKYTMQLIFWKEIMLSSKHFKCSFFKFKYFSLWHLLTCVVCTGVMLSIGSSFLFQLVSSRIHINQQNLKIKDITCTYSHFSSNGGLHHNV